MSKTYCKTYATYLKENEEFDSLKFILDIDENEEDSPFAALADLISKNAQEIKKDTAEELDDKEVVEVVDDAQSSNESVVVFALGSALSAGKLMEITGKSLKWLGKKVSSNEESAIKNVGNWLIRKGDHYTHTIEKFIIKLLEITPVSSKLMESLDEKQKIILAKAILTTLLIYLGINAGISVIEGFSKGENLFASVEAILTGTKGTEITENIPKIIKSVIAGSKALMNA